MGLIQDKDAISVATWRELGALTKATCVINTRVRGRIYLHNVEGARPTRRKLNAGLAFATRRWRGPLSAIQAPRKNPGRSRLAATARSREKEGMRDSPRGKSILKRDRHVFLPDNVLERVGSIPAIQSCRHT